MSGLGVCLGRDFLSYKVQPFLLFFYNFENALPELTICLDTASASKAYATRMRLICTSPRECTVDVYLLYFPPPTNHYRAGFPSVYAALH